MALLGLLLITACGEAYDTQAVRDMPVRGSMFNFALHSRYVDLAEERWALFDLKGTRRFNAKAKTAALGKAVMPDQPDVKDIPPHLRTIFKETEQELAELLKGGITMDQPTLAAEVQVLFDCWLWQASTEENHTCRQPFEAAAENLKSHLKIVTVVLLANDDGTVGSIEVRNEHGLRVLTQAGEATQLSAADPVPSEPFFLDEEEIRDMFGASLEARPNPPVRFNLSFEKNSSTLTAESRSLLPAILKEISIREVVEISVIGHTDRVSSDAYNKELSLKRARQVTQTLINRGVNAELIGTTSHGESNPLIRTPDDVEEPRNRRVEIIVR